MKRTWTEKEKKWEDMTRGEKMEVLRKKKQEEMKTKMPKFLNEQAKDRKEMEELIEQNSMKFTN